LKYIRKETATEDQKENNSPSTSGGIIRVELTAPQTHKTILRTVWKPAVHHRVHSNPPTLPIFSHMNPTPIPLPNSTFNTHFNHPYIYKLLCSSYLSAKTMYFVF
jgi:hypothetical protein